MSLLALLAYLFEQFLLLDQCMEAIAKSCAIICSFSFILHYVFERYYSRL
jgi:hypothetical protein